MRRRVFAAAVGALVSVPLAFASPASADRPIRFDIPEESQPGDIDCGTFHDEFVDTQSGFGTAFLDENGDVVRVILHLEQSSVDRNSVTGLTLEEHNRRILTFDFERGTLAQRGAQIVLNRPGSGIVVQETGRLVFDLATETIIFQAGQFDVIERGDEDAVFCEALA